MKLQSRIAQGAWHTVLQFDSELLLVQRAARDLFHWSDQKAVLRIVHEDGYPHSICKPPYEKWEAAALAPQPKETYR
jgi:hypothetical protein